MVEPKKEKSETKDDKKDSNTDGKKKPESEVELVRWFKHTFSNSLCHISKLRSFA